MTLTELTNKLWRFWEGLNEGKIDWDFINDENISDREREKAREMVVSRGFINIFNMDECPKKHSGHWKVVCGGNMNPCYFGKRWYFTSEKYAEDYVSYLIRNNKISRHYNIVRYYRDMET